MNQFTPFKTDTTNRFNEISRMINMFRLRSASAQGSRQLGFLPSTNVWDNN